MKSATALSLIFCFTQIQAISLKNVVSLVNARFNRNFDRITSAQDLVQYGIDPSSVDPNIIADATSTTVNNI